MPENLKIRKFVEEYQNKNVRIDNPKKVRIRRTSNRPILLSRLRAIKWTYIE